MLQTIRHRARSQMMVVVEHVLSMKMLAGFAVVLVLLVRVLTAGLVLFWAVLVV